jgi:hypothetical protein
MLVLTCLPVGFTYYAPTPTYFYLLNDWYFFIAQAARQALHLIALLLLVLHWWVLTGSRFFVALL